MAFSGRSRSFVSGGLMGWGILFLACQLSLLAPPENCQILQKAKENYLMRQKHPIDPDSLYLAAIVYTSPREWVIWMNGEKWTVDRFQSDRFSIQSVTSESVNLDINGTRVVLRPHQSYSPKLKTVFEGDILRQHKKPG